MIDMLSMGHIWLLLKTLAGLFVFLILFKISKFVISVYSRKRRYLKQGIPLVRFLGYRVAKEMEKLLDQHGDVMYPIKEAAKKNPAAKAFLVQQGPLFLLALTDPEYIKEFNNRIITDYDRLHIQKFIDPLMKNGITTLTGEDWKLHRKILSDSFHFDLLERSIADNHKATVEFFQNLSPQEIEGFVPRDQLKKVFSAITGRTFFGENVNERMIDGKSSLTYLFEILEEVVRASKNPFFLLPLVYEKKVNSSLWKIH